MCLTHCLLDTLTNAATYRVNQIGCIVIYNPNLLSRMPTTPLHRAAAISCVQFSTNVSPFLMFTATVTPEFYRHNSFVNIIDVYLFKVSASILLLIP